METLLTLCDHYNIVFSGVYKGKKYDMYDFSLLTHHNYGDLGMLLLSISKHRNKFL